MSLVELRDVAVGVPGRPSLINSLSWTIEPGDRIALMGPSGSGKSTLLAVLGGLLNPESGEVVRHPPLEPRTVGWIFQQTFVTGHRSVLDNIALGAIAAGMSWHDARTAAAVAADRVGLAARQTVRASKISGGERQRVGVARAIATARPLVLADEPTASLDADLVHEISQLLIDSLPEQTAVVIATHDERVARHCHRTVRLERGRLTTDSDHGAMAR